MRRVAICLLAICFAATASAGNLILNPGFEEGEDFDGWGNWNSHLNSRIVNHEELAHTGRQCLELAIDLPDQNYGGMVQNIWGRQGVTWGDTIEASCWVRTERLIGQEAYMLLEFLDDDWIHVGRFESEHVTGTHGWTKLTVRGTIPGQIEQPHLNKVHIALTISGKKSTGRVYFDSVRANKENE